MFSSPAPSSRSDRFAAANPTRFQPHGETTAGQTLRSRLRDARRGGLDPDAACRHAIEQQLHDTFGDGLAKHEKTRAIETLLDDPCTRRLFDQTFDSGEADEWEI